MKHLQLVFGILFTATCLLQSPVSSTQSMKYKHSSYVVDKRPLLIRSGKLTQEDKDNLRNICAAVWSTSLANRWNMNEDVATVVNKAVEEILVCSRRLGFIEVAVRVIEIVTGFLSNPIGGWLYLVRHTPDLIIYIDSMHAFLPHQACVNVAAANYRTVVEMASQGV